MRIFCSIARAFVLSLLHTGQHLLFGCPIARQLIPDHDRRDVLTPFEQLAEAFFRGGFVAATLDQDREQIAVLIDSPPQIMLFGADFKKPLIEMPFVASLRTASPQLVGRVLAEFPAALSNGFVGQYNAAGGHEFFDITIAEREAKLEPDGVADNFGREALAGVGGRIGSCCHAADDTTGSRGR